MKDIDGSHFFIRKQMNKFNALKQGSALIGLFLLSASAYSNPFVYGVVALWDSNTDPSTYGTAAVLYITVDNGSSTNFSQSYTWQDITNIHYSTFDGTFSLDSAGNQFTYSLLPAVAFLATDANGLGILTIDNSGANPGYFNTPYPGGGFAQFGAGTFTNIFYDNGQSHASFDASVSAASNNWIATAIPVPSPIPEPKSYAMILIGLGLVSVVLSRRKANLGQIN